MRRRRTSEWDFFSFVPLLHAVLDAFISFPCSEVPCAFCRRRHKKGRKSQRNKPLQPWTILFFVCLLKNFDNCFLFKIFLCSRANSGITMEHVIWTFSFMHFFMRAKKSRNFNKLNYQKMKLKRESWREAMFYKQRWNSTNWIKKMRKGAMRVLRLSEGSDEKRRLLTYAFARLPVPSGRPQGKANHPTKNEHYQSARKEHARQRSRGGKYFRFLCISAALQIPLNKTSTWFYCFSVLIDFMSFCVIFAQEDGFRLVALSDFTGLSFVTLSLAILPACETH